MSMCLLGSHMYEHVLTSVQAGMHVIGGMCVLTWVCVSVYSHSCVLIQRCLGLQVQRRGHPHLGMYSYQQVCACKRVLVGLYLCKPRKGPGPAGCRCQSVTVTLGLP